MRTTGALDGASCMRRTRAYPDGRALLQRRRTDSAPPTAPPPCSWPRRMAMRNVSLLREGGAIFRSGSGGRTAAVPPGAGSANPRQRREPPSGAAER